MTALRLVEHNDDDDGIRSAIEIADDEPAILSPTGEPPKRFTGEVSTFTGLSFVLSIGAIASILVAAFAFGADPVVSIYALLAVIVADAILVAAEIVGIRTRKR